MPRFTIRPLARRDLLEIWSYIADGSETQADLFIDKLHESMSMLLRQSSAGRRRDDLAPSLRSFPVGRYLLFYRVSSNGIEIVRVLHAARNVEILFQEG